MSESSNGIGKIIRTSLKSLVINVTNDELKYRNKYLPDPRRLSNDKIVCTVCSSSLAARVRKGKDIYVHSILGVLICKGCHSFYGDGIFSTDEDGDDKYCRWCGQGGTLYLCSKCNCGFCKKCLVKNMKNSALAELEKDDWKCLICIPRPIFGSRAVCWASQQLNNNARKLEFVRRKLEEEKAKLEAEDKSAVKEEEEAIKPFAVREGTTKKRLHDSEDSNHSTVFIPAKKLKEDVKTKTNLNGGIKKHRRKKENLSTYSESSDDSQSSNLEKRKRGKLNKYQSLSSGESSSTFKKKRKLKQKSKTNSDESSDSDEVVPKSIKTSHKKSFRTKRKKKFSKRKNESASDASNESSAKLRENKKKVKRSKGKSLNNTSSSEDKVKSDRSDSEEKQEIVHQSGGSEGNNGCREVETPKNDNNINNNAESVEIVKQKQSENEFFDGNENLFFEKSEIENELSIGIPMCNQSQVFGNEQETLPNIQKQRVNENLQLCHQNLPLVDDDFTLSYNESSSKSEEFTLTQEDEVKVKVQLAIEWLGCVSTDIADLGGLISNRTSKFGERKVNLDNLRSYEDVLSTLVKLKQLLGGIHTNYRQIEDSLEDKLISWKILAGLEKSDLEEQLYDEGNKEMQTEDDALATGEAQAKVEEAQVEAHKAQAEVDKTQAEVDDAQAEVDEVQAEVDEVQAEVGGNTQVVGSELQCKDILEASFKPNKDQHTLCSEVNTLFLPRDEKAVRSDLEISSINDNKKNYTQNNEFKNAVSAKLQDILKKENEPEELQNELVSLHNNITIINASNGGEVTIALELKSENVDDAIIKAESNLKSGSSNLVWSGLLSSDDSSDLNEDIAAKMNLSSDDEKIFEDNHEPEICDVDNKKSHEKEGDSEKVNEKDSENFEALQELLYSSTEPEIESSDSDSYDSDEIQLDDSDLDEILKPRKVVVKKCKRKETKVEEVHEDSKEKVEGKREEEEDDDKNQKKKEVEKKAEEPLDSEAEIDMLTDLSKLKKKSVLKKVEQQSSEESSSEELEDDENEGQNENKKRRKKYNTDIKKKREQERNELFGFLHGNSSTEDEVDITKNDLDVMEDQYLSGSSDSMSMEAFSRKMNEKWRELEKEQDHLNLQLLLAPESEEGSVGGEDLVLDSDDEKKKKKGKKIKEEKINEVEANLEKDDEVVKVKEEKGDEAEVNRPVESDQEYEQFMEDLTKSRTMFTGLGSSSEDDKNKEEIDVKEEPLSDQDAKVKKELKSSDAGESSNSESSSDVFLDITKKKSEKKLSWRHHKLLRMKLSDTDTSDEERWWQRRLEREKKKKEQENSPNKSLDLENKRKKKKKEDNGSDKENKKIKKENEDEESNSSSTLEMSSTDSSGSEIFKKKKKKKKESSDSDVIILSDIDKKKKKKKKRMNLSGGSSENSEESDDAVIDITQKSSQGESPGKGGRKNIRKVLTKHELAAATKAAAKEEEERKKRIAARQKLFNEMFETKEAEVLEKLVLDFDPETKTELISVDKDLVTKMKPHQAKGVKFMWDSCFESLSELKTKKGSGCILAHCMGLGKTFQVVSLVHTILTHKDTNVRTVLVVCPLSTVLNWYNEFDKWLEGVSGGRNIKIYHLTKYKKAHERSKQLSQWHRTGGVMILGYEMFRILANSSSKKFRLMHMEVFQKTLIDPGADLVVCDEGHMLKNESTALSKAMSRIRTLRRIVLTGTPMQNNLKEYHCMVQFVKPNLLGTRKEFLNQFVNPITNGQFVDSTEADVKVMKRRAHVLHKMLEGLVQRFDYSVLMPFLPPKYEYVISLRLSDVQVKLYQFYLDYFCQKKSEDKRTSSQLFQDWQVLGRIWTHPRVLKLSTDKAEKEKQESSTESEDERRRLRSQKSIKDFFKKKKNSSSADSSKQESEDEGSIKDFINDKSSSSSLSLSSSNSTSSSDENGGKKDKVKKKKDKKVKKNGNEPEKKEVLAPEVPAVELVDEINLVSSEEEGGDQKEEVKEVNEDQKADANSEKEDKISDSGIEDQEGKTGDDHNKEETTSKVQTDIKVKEDDKESIVEETQENKDEKSEKEKKKIEVEQLGRRGGWWKDIIDSHHLEDINQSAKLVLLFAILRECEMIEDKVLVFSQSLFSLDLIEYFLEKVDRATEENRLDESLGNHAGCWQKGLDYFRLDGSSSSESRSQWCKSFNREDNPRARLFLISTRAGGLGINLTGANRVVIFDASWNPSHDIQSIFRIYRFGQKKPCYVYRFVAHGTMEEKVYDRQVAKQSLSSRVVDEQQVHRHFSMNDLNELYNFTPPQERTEKPTPVLPKDRLMAELLTQYNDWIEKYHEHDSLLENIAEEELNEEERKLAWEDYENEKKRGFLPPASGTGVPNFPGVANQIELFRKSLQLKFPKATESEMNSMLQTLMYQVNFRVTQQMGGQQQGQQSTVGSSQQQHNFRGMVQEMTAKNVVQAQQMFNSQRNHLYQKYGTQVQSQTMQPQRIVNNPINQQRIGNGQISQQRVGNGQIRQQRMGNGQINQQRIGNGMNNRTSQEIYMEQMRKQQQANLTRIQNQRFQEKLQQQVNPRQPVVQQRNLNRGPQVDKGIQRVVPMRQPQQQQQNIWKSNQPLPVNPNQLQQMQQRQNVANILNRQNRQVTPVANVTSMATKPQQSQQEPRNVVQTPHQKMQEQMRQRISALQRQKSRQTYQQNVQQRVQKSGSIDPVQQRQLDEMKKRYAASRMKQTSGEGSKSISIVEIDDEPGM